MTLSPRLSLTRLAALAAVLLLLNVSLSFENVWPTPAVTWRGALAVELAGLLLVLALAAFWRSPLPAALIRGVSVIWLLLIIGRYTDVTSTALFGREINLYWDLRFMPDVASLFATAAQAWMVVAAIAVFVLALAVLWTLVRWAVGRVAGATMDLRVRVIMAVAGAGLITGFLLQAPVVDYETPRRAFATPVSGYYVRQARLAVRAATGRTWLPASPAIRSDLSRVLGADVLLVFLESYGAITYDKPWLADRLSTSRKDLQAAIDETGRAVVSAFVESPTFGGASWLAHISLMSGLHVPDHDTNALLMTETRDTWAKAMARGGYRTIALMPAIWQRWPEGSFYGFDEIYDGERLGYRGPPFGWFSIPDQFALAKFDALAGAQPSRPVFMFFPTITTHAPFTPTPPYQPDWPRMLTDRPYEASELQRVYEETPDWTNLGPGYAGAIAYSFATFAGYLRAHPERDIVMVLLGDHQPPALVTGPGAPWDVPVHVIASRPAVLERLRANGFAPGLTPQRPHLGRMHTLLPIFLDALGDTAKNSEFRIQKPEAGSRKPEAGSRTP